MLIGQLTDIHIGFDRENPREANLLRLEQVVAHIATQPQRPDLLLLTGDLTEHGDPASYRVLRQALAPLDVPLWAIPGNHDDRAALLDAFPEVQPMAGGFAQYALSCDGLRVLMLDTLEEQRHGGGFCQARAGWLAEQLAAHPTTPTLIALHHPPFAAGIPWMDTDPREPWVARLAKAITGHDQIRLLTCGHVHRPTLTQWNHVPAVICPSTAPAVALDMRPIAADQPDGRALLTDEAPAYLLHRWDGAALVSHVVYAQPAPVLASYTPALATMVASMLAERPEAAD